MATSNLAVDVSHLQSHTTTATHRGLALFLFLRFLSKNEKKNRAQFALAALDGTSPVSLRAQMGEKPLVLVFGSFT